MACSSSSGLPMFGCCGGVWPPTGDDFCLYRMVITSNLRVFKWAIPPYHVVWDTYLERLRMLRTLVMGFSWDQRFPEDPSHTGPSIGERYPSLMGPGQTTQWDAIACWDGVTEALTPWVLQQPVMPSFTSGMHWSPSVWLAATTNVPIQGTPSPLAAVVRIRKMVVRRYPDFPPITAGPAPYCTFDYTWGNVLGLGSPSNCSMHAASLDFEVEPPAIPTVMSSPFTWPGFDEDYRQHTLSAWPNETYDSYTITPTSLASCCNFAP